jgi:site-specific recombinase XerD
MSCTYTDNQIIEQSLSEAGLAPISRARTLAAVKACSDSAGAMAYIESDPAVALPLPRYESRLVEKMIGEGDVERLLSVEASLCDRTLVAMLYKHGQSAAWLAACCCSMFSPFGFSVIEPAEVELRRGDLFCFA